MTRGRLGQGEGRVDDRVMCAMVWRRGWHCGACGHTTHTGDAAECGKRDTALLMLLAVMLAVPKKY